MSIDVELQCRCGAIHGVLKNASPRTVNRAVCYCDDCQSFLHHLGRADLMDASGGTDIVQAAPAAISFDRGLERISGVRLSPKGMFRWYASCCKTPLGNTLAPHIPLPFVGMGPEIFRADKARRDEMFGPSRGGYLGKFAIGEPPPGSTGLNPRLIAHSLLRMLGWKLRRQTWPHPFFDKETRAPRWPIKVLTLEERQALRALCGPRP
jgi:hypothetical protein